MLHPIHPHAQHGTRTTQPPITLSHHQHTHAHRQLSCINNHHHNHHPGNQCYGPSPAAITPCPAVHRATQTGNVMTHQTTTANTLFHKPPIHHHLHTPETTHHGAQDHTQETDHLDFKADIPTNFIHIPITWRHHLPIPHNHTISFHTTSHHPHTASSLKCWRSQTDSTTSQNTTKTLITVTKQTRINRNVSIY